MACTRLRVDSELSVVSAKRIVSSSRLSLDKTVTHFVENNNAPVTFFSLASALERLRAPTRALTLLSFLLLSLAIFLIPYFLRSILSSRMSHDVVFFISESVMAIITYY